MAPTSAGADANTDQEANQRSEVVRLMTHPGVDLSRVWTTFWSSGRRISFLVANRSLA
jgi:hypothetical protein